MFILLILTTNELLDNLVIHLEIVNFIQQYS